MPMAPPRACSKCGGLDCQLHKSGGWAARRVVVAPRIRGRKLQRIRKQTFEAEPFCRPCKAAGLYTLATIVDHIIPLAEGGLDIQSNRQPICGVCHDAKTRDEATRRLDRAE